MTSADPSSHDSTPAPCVSRGGLKLQHALRHFAIPLAGKWCADFGASTGGFTDCLLRHGATRVYAIDTAYGQLAWKLRNDPRVVVMERTNALRASPPPEVSARGGVDLVVIDAGWTPQRLIVPAAQRWLATGGSIVSLIKPHYELRELGQELPRGGVLDDALAESVATRVAAELPRLGVRVGGLTRSPILGGARKGKGQGNAEWLVLLHPT